MINHSGVYYSFSTLVEGNVCGSPFETKERRLRQIFLNPSIRKRVKRGWHGSNDHSHGKWGFLCGSLQNWHFSSLSSPLHLLSRIKPQKGFIFWIECISLVMMPYSESLLCFSTYNLKACLQQKRRDGENLKFPFMESIGDSRLLTTTICLLDRN